MPDNPFGVPGLFVDARIRDDGAFEIEEQHLGGGAHIGRDDYEYFHVVRPEALPALAAALGCSSDGIIAAWEEQKVEIVRHGEQRWLKQHGIAYETTVL